MAEEIQESEKVAQVIKQYEYINKTKKKGIIAYHQWKRYIEVFYRIRIFWKLSQGH